MVAKTKLLAIAAAILFLAGFAFAASCSVEAYRNACANCPFDKSGKIDQKCKEGYKSGGIACVSATYPLMSAEYARGKCPRLDACAEMLQSCIAQYTSGNDKEDCASDSVRMCYQMSDACVDSAANQCPAQQECSVLTGLIMLVVFGAFLAGFIRKQ
ncbi:MAG: hypothetical protein N3E51_04970 [Candidatus Micrarchaeota archaeon]|nr:hypothetical protein [Candidatus Micrarchaeota archaeon]